MCWHSWNPPCSNFDLAKRDADNGLAETKRIFGGEYAGDWNHVYKESRWNLLPKWQVRSRERQRESERETERNRERGRERQWGWLSVPVGSPGRC